MLKFAPFALLLSLATCPAPKPVTPPVTPPIQPPATYVVHVQVNGDDGGVPAAMASVQIATVPDTWAWCSTNARGHCELTVPASLTASHLTVVAMGWNELSQHVELRQDVTLTVTLSLVHQSWPSDASKWTRFACDITGVRVPEILQWGRTPAGSSWIVPLYPQALRASIYADMRARGYTHVVLDPRPKYGDWYPSGVLSVEDFRSALHEALDAGLLPIVFWIPDIADPSDPGEWQRLIGPYLDDPEIRALAKLNAVAWEVNGWADPVQVEAMIRWLRARLAPDARLFIHFTPSHAASCLGDSCESRWWARMAAENLLDGIFLQLEPDATLEDQVGRAIDFTQRFVYGLNGWPMRRADGRPLMVVAFEYSAYPETRERMTEDEARRRGTALAAIPGMSGACDGLTVR